MRETLPRDREDVLAEGRQQEAQKRGSKRHTRPSYVLAPDEDKEWKTPTTTSQRRTTGTKRLRLSQGASSSSSSSQQQQQPEPRRQLTLATIRDSQSEDEEDVIEIKKEYWHARTEKRRKIVNAFCASEHLYKLIHFYILTIVVIYSFSPIRVLYTLLSVCRCIGTYSIPLFVPNLCNTYIANFLYPFVCFDPYPLLLFLLLLS